MKRHNITKNTVLKEIYYNLGIPSVFSEKILNSVIEILIEGLNRDYKVKISRFGTFKVVERAPRTGRNPRTGSEVRISSRKAPTFKPSKELRARVDPDNTETGD